MKSYTTTTLVCTNLMSCDALLEVTSKWFDIHTHGACPVCFSELAVISAEQSPTKEERMETTLEQSYIQELELKYGNEITELKNRLDSIIQREFRTTGDLQGMRDAMHEWTTTQLADLGINQEQAEEIAEICGFELSTEVEVEVSVTYNITIEVPAGETAEEIVEEIDFDAISYNSDKVTSVYCSVDRISI